MTRGHDGFNLHYLQALKLDSDTISAVETIAAGSKFVIDFLNKHLVGFNGNDMSQFTDRSDLREGRLYDMT